MIAIETDSYNQAFQPYNAHPAYAGSERNGTELIRANFLIRKHAPDHPLADSRKALKKRIWMITKVPFTQEAD
jgi:hypothetical protein